MFYYAEINSEYQVVDKHSLSEASTNPNYISVTEDLYNNGNELGDIVGQYYNTLLGVIEIVDPGWDMGQSHWVTHKNTQMRLSTKIDNMDKTISLKSDIDHAHTDYALSDDLESLEDTVATKANATHTHSEYSPLSHSHSYNDLSDKPTIPSAYTLPTAGSDLGGVKTGGDVTISSGTITVNDDSHNHIISNIDNLQSTLDGKASSSHTHTAAALVEMASALFGTGSGGGVEYSYGSGSGKNVLTEISNMATGLHTAYAITGTTGNPRTTESFRFLIHKTSTTIGWVLAWDAQGSIFTNYQSAANTFKGWKCLYDASPSSMILWSGEAYMQSVNSTPQVVTPSKKLSQCRTGWMLLWSDYDPGDGANDTDFCTTFIPKYTPSGGTWGGKAFYCDIPMYVGSDVTDLSTEKRCIKPIYVHDDCLKGSYQNTSGGRNDVVLRAVYEV